MVEKDASMASTVFETLFISKSIERVVDHAVNVSKEAVFMATSRDVRYAPEYKKSEPAKKFHKLRLSAGVIQPVQLCCSLNGTCQVRDPH